MNAIGGVDFGNGEIRHNIESMEQMTGQFLKVFDLTDLVDFRDDPVEGGLNFLIRLIRKKRSLVLEPDLVSKEFLAVKL